VTGQQCLFDDLIELQAGVVSRPQALAAGMSRNMVVVRLRSGRWQQLHWGVYATFSGKPGRLATLWAALLRVSHGATLSHQTAAELDGIITKAAPMIHVTVSSGLRLARIPGVRLHYSGHLALARHPVRQPPPRGNAR